MNVPVAAYLAGIIDGEGSISIVRCSQEVRQKSPFHELRIAVSNTSKAMLNFLQSQVGGDIGSVRRGTNTGMDPKYKFKPQWQWRITSTGAYDLLKSMRPYLIVKLAQAETGIEFWEKRTRLRGGGRGHTLTEDEIRLRDLYWSRMKSLNA